MIGASSSPSSPSQSFWRPTCTPPPLHPPSSPHTHVPPHGQVLILLHIQHDLQPAAHATLGSSEKLCPVHAGVKGVALAHPGEDLGMGRQVADLTREQGPWPALPPGKHEDLGTSPLHRYLDLFFDHKTRISGPPVSPSYRHVLLDAPGTPSPQLLLFPSPLHPSRLQGKRFFGDRCERKWVPVTLLQAEGKQVPSSWQRGVTTFPRPR